MSCKGEGATHHHACDCREKMFKELADALEGLMGYEMLIKTAHPYGDATPCFDAARLALKKAGR